MGSTADPWRAAETWIPCLASHSVPLHAALPRVGRRTRLQGYKERQDKVLRLRRNLVDQGASGIDPTRRSCRAWHSIGLRRRGRQGGAGDRGDYGPAAASDGRGKKRKAKAAGRIEGNITTP